jgi:hypothetical protein
MKCVCGATVPLTSRSSLCAGCLHGSFGYADGDYEGYYESVYETDAEW